MSTPQKTARRCLCKHLRAKEMYYSNSPGEIDQFHSGIFWCDRTHDALGPDGVYADNEECNPVRSCFQE